MKNRRLVVIVLIAALLLSGCGSSAAPADTPEEAASSDETAQTDTEEPADEAIPAEPAAEPDSQSESEPDQQLEPEPQPEPEPEPEPEPQLFEFNPHPYSELLAKEIPEDHWESLYNLSDALREGADTFACSSQEAYDWCMDTGTLANLIPAACLKISGESPDGTAPFENGAGRIYYNMPAEEFVARQAEFEQKVTEVLNDALETDDNEYEKCLKLYDYMASNYDYNYEDDADKISKDGYVYVTFMDHTGKCIDLAGLYSFLLLEAGVEALSVGSYNDLDHAWTYAVVNGQGYHIDPTWALKSSRYTDSLYLDYFMMSDDIRTATGCTVDDLTVQLLPQFWVEFSSLSLPATDESYYLGDFTTFKSLDEENKILWYYDMSDEVHELDYAA